MTTIPFYSAGDLGVIKDIAPNELPPLAWSDARNVHFRNGKAIRRRASKQVFGIPSIVPYWTMFAFTPTNGYWLYGDLNGKVYVTDGNAHTDITRVSGGDYTINKNRLWNGGLFSQLPVITNGTDNPQVWSSISESTHLTDLSNWPANTLCKVIRPFLNFLVAMNITKSGTDYASLVKWSDAAVPGSLPGSWDETDATKLAGELELVDSVPGAIVNALSLRDSLYIYKNNTTWRMQYIGGNDVFSFNQVLVSSGAVGYRSVCEVQEGMAHVVMNGFDLLLFDGNSISSVLDKRMRKWLVNNLNSAYSSRCVCISDKNNYQAWLLFPGINEEWPNMALVWNWKDNTVSIMELEAHFATMAIGSALELSGGDTWDDATSGSWDTDTDAWNKLTFSATEFSLIAGDIDNTQLLVIEPEEDYVGTSNTVYLERTDLTIIGFDKFNYKYKADISQRKLVTRIWPKVDSKIIVKVGSQEYAGGPVTWATAQNFDPTIQRYLDFSVNGQLIAVRFENPSSGTAIWELTGFDLEMQILGNL